MNFVEETFLSLGSQSGEDLGRNESRDNLDSQPSN